MENKNKSLLVQIADSPSSYPNLKDMIMKSSPHRWDFNSVSRKSYDYDPNNYTNQYDFANKHSLVSDNSKLMIFLKDPIVSAIVQTYSNQVLEFSKPQENRYSTGFIFRRKDREAIRDEDKANIHLLCQYITNCGISDRDRTSANEDLDFGTFLKLIVKDRLIYDPIAIERIFTNSGHIHHFLPVSSPTIRYASPRLDKASVVDDEPMLREEDDEPFKYVQIIQGTKKKGFTSKELIFKLGNPSNDLFTNGYSIGEIDLLMNVITAHLNLDTRNRSMFENSFVAPGIINLKGEVSEEQLEAFRRAYYAQGVGPGGMYRTPILNANEGVEYLKTGLDGKDMEFGNYSEYLIKVICAIYQIAPEELNFSSINSNGGSGGSGGSNYNNLEKRLEYSKNKGLKPLLNFIEDIINTEIMPYLNFEFCQDYEFHFAGLEDEDKLEEIDRLKKESEIYKTLNECRIESGLPRIPDDISQIGLGDIPLNGIFIQFLQIKMQQQQMEQQQAQMQQPQSNYPFDMQDQEQQQNKPLEKSLKIEWVQI